MNTVVETIRNADWIVKPLPAVVLLMLTTMLLMMQLEYSSRRSSIMTAATCVVGETSSPDGRVQLNLTCVKEGVTKVVQVRGSAETVRILNARATQVTCTVYASAQADDCVIPTN